MHQGNVKSWKGRSHLTALLSEDDGKTWPYTLLLDERNEVSYPDAKEAADGYIYVSYDWERVTQREILMARFTEDDILNGKISSSKGKLRILVKQSNRATRYSLIRATSISMGYPGEVVSRIFRTLVCSPWHE